jgi:NAD-dependent deacetylase
MANRSIVILTGAGISQESGLDTFRCEGGIWAQVDLEDVATPEGFARNPDLVHQFYNDRRAGLLHPDIQPNAAHLALASLANTWPHGDVHIVTQNIDDLHTRAGSQNVMHMHGELRKAWCLACNEKMPWDDALSVTTPCPKCKTTGCMRPDIVWFGEIPYGMDHIMPLLSECALFISIGTSGNVYPAAGFVMHVRDYGHGQTLELNLDPSQGASLFDYALYGRATQNVPNFVRALCDAAIHFENADPAAEALALAQIVKNINTHEGTDV